MSLFQTPLFLLFITAVQCLSDEKREEQAKAFANTVYNNMVQMFDECKESKLYNEKFMVDNPYNYINAYSRTTVGFAHKFTTNRKFFANLINTVKFREMLNNDLTILQKNYVDKVKFCDESVLDKNLLKELYPRDTDEANLIL